MSIEMYKEASLEQATTTSTFCRSQVEAYSALQAAINKLVEESSTLKGAAYDSARAYFMTVIAPLIKAGQLLTEAVEVAVTQLPVKYEEEVSLVGLKQVELEEAISHYDMQIHGLKQSLAALEALPNLPSRDLMRWEYLQLLTQYSNLKQSLENKLQKLLAFNTASQQLFSEIETLSSLVTQGLAQVQTNWETPMTAFKTPVVSTDSWQTIVNKRWEVREA